MEERGGKKKEGQSMITDVLERVIFAVNLHFLMKSSGIQLLKLYPPAVAAGALMYFFHHSFYLRCVFFPPFTTGSRGCSLRSSEYLESELRVFGSLPTGGSRSPPQKKKNRT